MRNVITRQDAFCSPNFTLSLMTNLELSHDLSWPEEYVPPFIYRILYDFIYSADRSYNIGHNQPSNVLVDDGCIAKHCWSYLSHVPRFQVLVDFRWNIILEHVLHPLLIMRTSQHPISWLKSYCMFKNIRFHNIRHTGHNPKSKYLISCS
jgi:hypothetical protein